MPYSKTFVKGKARPRRRAKTKNGRQDQRIRKLEQTIYPSIEYKTKDKYEKGIAVSTGGSSRYPMITLLQGAEADERVGDKVTLQSLKGQMTVTKGDSDNLIRVILAVTPSSTQLTMDDVLQYDDLVTYGDLVFCSPYRLKASSDSKTYKILFDKVYNITDQVNSIVDKFNCDLTGIHKQLNWNSVLDTSPDNFKVSLLMISDSASVVHPTVSYNLRMKYYDL